MRTIKFRGKRTDKDEWIYGYLADGNCICDWDNKERRSFEVKAKTIGQYTGLVDKNGNEIYEGDIVKTKGNWGGVVTWNSRGYFYINDGYYTEEPDLLPLGSLNCYVRRDFEIVGNIHDNPELIKKGE